VLLLFCNVSAAVTLPARLHTGDRVGLVSSASRVPEDAQIDLAILRLKALGLKVKVGKTVYLNQHSFAGSDAARAKDLNDMFADDAIKAIFELRGGWGSERILPLLDFSLIKSHPKILVGFSDITSLLLAIYSQTGLVSFHGPVASQPWPSDTVSYLKQVLFAAQPVKYVNPDDFDETQDIVAADNRIHTIHPGVVKGKLIGGNLTTLTALLGSKYFPDMRHAILFVEDVSENYYKIDRYLMQLKLAGVLDQIDGFVFGQCTDCSAAKDGAILGSDTLRFIKVIWINILDGLRCK